MSRLALTAGRRAPTQTSLLRICRYEWMELILDRSSKSSEVRGRSRRRSREGSRLNCWLICPSLEKLTRTGRAALPLRSKDTRLSKGEATAESARTREDSRTRPSSISISERGLRQGLCGRVARSQGSQRALAASTGALVASVLPHSAATKRLFAS